MRDDALEVERLERDVARDAVTSWLALKEISEAAARACTRAREYASDKLQGHADGVTINGKRYKSIPSMRDVHVGLAPWKERAR